MTENGKPLVVTVSGKAAESAGTESGCVNTPMGRADIYVKVVAPLTIISVRAGRVFLQTLLGLVTAGLVSPTTLGAKDFMHLLGLCAGLSVAPAVICVIQNVIELMAKFDQSHPTITS